MDKHCKLEPPEAVVHPTVALSREVRGHRPISPELAEALGRVLAGGLLDMTDVPPTQPTEPVMTSRSRPGSTEESVGALVKRQRLAKGLTQGALADAAQISTGYVGMIEKGRRGQSAKRDLLLRLARGLQLNPKDTEDLFRAAGQLRPGQSLIPQQALSVEDAVRQDDRLSESSKELFLGVYAVLSGKRLPAGRTR